jgi:paraquat-inducible protein A
LQALATITPGPGAIAFGAVVVLTMFAAMAFDPRLMWDPLEEERG